MSHQPETNRCGNPMGRRTFFQMLTFGLSALAAVALGIPLIGYFIGNWPNERFTGFPWTKWTSSRSTKLC